MYNAKFLNVLNLISFIVFFICLLTMGAFQLYQTGPAPVIGILLSIILVILTEGIAILTKDKNK